MTLGCMLGETAIDISGGNDHSGRAEPGTGSPAPGVPDYSKVSAKLLGMVGPVMGEVKTVATLKTLQTTAANYSEHGQARFSLHPQA